MIKVMHVLNTGKYSGAENVVITLINETKGRVDSFYVSFDGTIREYLNENGIQFVPIEKMTVGEIKKVINIIQPDIIEAHDFTTGIICAMSTNRPIINHIHNNSPWLRHYGLRSFAFLAGCLKYNIILTVSDSVMNEYVFGKWFKNKTRVIGNPIDIQRINIMKSQYVPCNRETYDIAFLGRLSAQKNPFMFLDIINEIHINYKSIRAIMIGDGELRKDVEARIRELALESIVDMVGFMKNPLPLLNTAKILCMPSKWEGFGLAAVEALALGKPVICSDAGGLPQIVDETCGKVCNSIQEYVTAIERLLDDNMYYQQLSQGAIQKACRMNNIGDYCSKLLRIYVEVLS